MDNLKKINFAFEQAKMKYIATKRRPYLAQGVPERTALLHITSTHKKKSLVNAQTDERARPPQVGINT
jgi:hypothetical protein